MYSVIYCLSLDLKHGKTQTAFQKLQAAFQNFETPLVSAEIRPLR